MPRRIVRHPLASRRTILAAFAGLLTRPAAVHGQAGGICRDLGISPLPSENHPDFLWRPVSVSGASAAAKVRLQLQVAADGRVRGHGAIRLRDDAGTTILVVRPEQGQAACADLNGNGVVGLTRVQLRARNPRTDERVAVTLTARAGDDLDGQGFGFVTFQTGEREMAIEVEVRLLPARRVPRKRRGRKR